MADVFISYANKDRDHARKIASALEACGWSVWWDRKIVVGRTFDQAIEEELDRAKSVVVLWSKASISSEWVKNESAAAMKRGKLIPALIDSVEQPLEFRRRQTANLVVWDGASSHEGFQALVEGISAVADSIDVEPRQTAPSQGVRVRWNRFIMALAISVAVLGIAAWVLHRLDAARAQQEASVARTVASSHAADDPPYYGNSIDGNVRPQMEAYIRAFRFPVGSKPAKEAQKLMEMIEERKNAQKPTEFFDADNTFRAKLDTFRNNVRLYAISGKWPDG